MDALTVVSSLLKVVAVLALLVISLRVLARYQGGRGKGRMGLRGRPDTVIEVLEQSRLGRSASLAAVRVGDRVLLLGMTENRVETLADVTNDIDLTIPDEPGEDAGDQSMLDHAIELLRSGSFGPRAGTSEG